jgi:hypothetical protein
MNDVAIRMVGAVLDQTIEDTHLLISWIVSADDSHELVYRALPWALRRESGTVIDSFDSAIIMIPAFRRFDIQAAVAAQCLHKRPLVRKN